MEKPKSSRKNRILAGVMAAFGALGAADCTIHTSPGGRINVRNGRMEACSEDPSYIQQFRGDCKLGTERVLNKGNEQCLRCEVKD